MDMDWLYNRAFADPDGHVFEALSMNMNAASKMMSEQSAESA